MLKNLTSQYVTLVQNSFFFLTQENPWSVCMHSLKFYLYRYIRYATTGINTFLFYRLNFENETIVNIYRLLVSG